MDDTQILEGRMSEPAIILNKSHILQLLHSVQFITSAWFDHFVFNSKLYFKPVSYTHLDVYKRQAFSPVN